MRIKCSPSGVEAGSITLIAAIHANAADNKICVGYQSKVESSGKVKWQGNILIGHWEAELRFWEQRSIILIFLKGFFGPLNLRVS